MADEPQFLRATTAFVVADPEVGRRRVTPGTVVAADDPLVAGREALFEAAEADATAPVAPDVAPRASTRRRAPAKRTSKRAPRTAKAAAGSAAKSS